MVVHARLKISYTLTLQSLMHKLAWLIDFSSFAGGGVWVEVYHPLWYFVI